MMMKQCLDSEAVVMALQMFREHYTSLQLLVSLGNVRMEEAPFILQKETFIPFKKFEFLNS